MRKLLQRWLSGMTRIIAGIMSAVGNMESPRIRNPVATMIIPPQALKSFIIDGVVNGKIRPAAKKSARKIRNCGIATRETTAPNVQAKIMAVKKSRIDLEMRIL